MPITPRAMRRFLPALAGALITGWTSGCATERFERSAPSGVNLTGEWRLNLNLSDDPGKISDPSKDSSRAPGSGGRRGGRGGHGGGGGGVVPPYGSSGPGAGFNAEPGEAVASDIQDPAPPPPSTSAPAPNSSSSHATNGHLFQPPVHLTIEHSGVKIIIKSEWPDGSKASDEYTPGVDTTIPYGESTAERSVGWRGPAFVITTKPKKGSSKEEDLALDDDGRLILTTQMKGGRLGKLDVKSVYDRVKP